MTTIAPAALRLNLACGDVVWDGFANSDIRGDDGTDFLDLDAFPYPLADNSADLILMSHALFMLNEDGGPLHPKLDGIFAECYRILRPRGWLRIDDNPIRCYDNRDHLHGSDYDDEAARGYPVEFRRPRAYLVQSLHVAGFPNVIERSPHGPNDTSIPYDDVRHAIVANRGSHLSFSIEAQK